MSRGRCYGLHCRTAARPDGHPGTGETQTPSALAFHSSFLGVPCRGSFGRTGQPSGVGAVWSRTFADPASLPDVDARLRLADLLDRGAVRFRGIRAGGAVLAATRERGSWGGPERCACRFGRSIFADCGALYQPSYKITRGRIRRGIRDGLARTHRGTYAKDAATSLVTGAL